MWNDYQLTRCNTSTQLVDMVIGGTTIKVLFGEHYVKELKNALLRTVCILFATDNALTSVQTMVTRINMSFSAEI